MRKLKEMKIAMVGAGFAANIHAEAYHWVPGVDVKVVGVCDTDEARAKKFCEEHRFDQAKVHADVDEMIADTDAEIVDLVVPPFLHVPLAIKAAKAGKNIICEKPLTGYFGDPSVPVEERENVGATDKATMLRECLRDCRDLAKTLEEEDVVFCYAENWVNAPPIAKAKRLVRGAGGKILEIRCGESHSGSHSPFAAEWKYQGGGALIRMGAHPYGAAVHLKLWEGEVRDGEPIYPKSIVATTARYRDFLDDLPREQDHVVSRPVDVEDWSTGVITFDDGTNAVCVASDVTLGGIENWLNVYASNCRVECRISNNDSVMAYAPTPQQFKDNYTIEKTETKAGWSHAQPDEDWMTGYPAEMTEFVNAVLEKRRPNSDVELAIWTTKVIYSAYLSAETGRRVEIPRGFDL
ncbi:MAG: Gfo/Idh/MocA family protein [Promethearchaeota archaeon]